MFYLWLNSSIKSRPAFPGPWLYLYSRPVAGSTHGRCPAATTNAVSARCSTPCDTKTCRLSFAACTSDVTPRLNRACVCVCVCRLAVVCSVPCACMIHYIGRRDAGRQAVPPSISTCRRQPKLYAKFGSLSATDRLATHLVNNALFLYERTPSWTVKTLIAI